MRQRNPPEKTEVLIIGGGPGGYVAAIRAGQLGLDVTLVDREYGGTCLNRGCIPSKALITATETVHNARSSDEMGIHAEVDVEMPKLVDWKDGVVDQLTKGVEKLCRAQRVSLVDGYAAFEDAHTATVDLTDGGTHTIEFDHAIVSTGSRPIEVPGFSYEADPVLSSDGALSLREIPDSLVIVGAGYIGMELAGVYAKLGTDVTVIEMLDSAMPLYEDDLVRPVRKRAESLGVSFNFGEQAAAWEEATSGIEVKTETAEGQRRHYEGDYVLVAVGREPVTDTVNLGAVGIEPTEEGFIETDDRTRTAVDHVLAVGDVAGEPMLAHKASAEGTVAAEVLAGEDARVDYRAVPAAVFTDPEVGTVGHTEADAEAAGLDPIVGEFPLRASGRSLTLGNTDGFIRIVAAGDSGRVVGGQVVGPEASELIAEIGLAVETDTTLEEVAGTIHTHPTLSEGVMEASENALGRAIHTLNR